MPMARPAHCAEPGQIGLINHGLVGTGAIPADRRDGYGETTISASGMAIDLRSWRREGNRYRGVFYLLPDRGWNTGGTIDYHPRIHKVSIEFSPRDEPGARRGDEVSVKRIETILLRDSAGRPLTGLDAVSMSPKANGFAAMPRASNGRISIDPEAIVLAADRSFFISDEYGPYIYRFSANGRMLAALRPPEVFIPVRGKLQSFYSKDPRPDAGRQNNQGFEGMALTPDGKTLAVLLQSALVQDGGNSGETRQYTRMLRYDVSKLAQPKLMRQYVVELPQFTDGKRKVAAQSEMIAIDNHRFLLLCRDSDNGLGGDHAVSVFRKIMLLDIAEAPRDDKYDYSLPIAPNGKLADGVSALQLKPFIDINDNEQLKNFGLQNGSSAGLINLSEKWESMGLVPALDPAQPRDYFLFVANDNDFKTRNGFQAGVHYEDRSGVDVETRFLVYRITLPDSSRSSALPPN